MQLHINSLTLSMHFIRSTLETHLKVMHKYNHTRH